MLLSAAIIVKNEELRLPACLQSIAPLVDEIVVYDSGSTDGTVALARAVGALVIEGYWDDDFSRARNAGLGHCRGEWALCIDADDIAVGDRGLLRAELDSAALAAVDALLVDIDHLGHDGRSVAIGQRFARLIRPSRLHWTGRLHEQPELRPGLAGPSTVALSTTLRLRHSGQETSAVAGQSKVERNLRVAWAEYVTSPEPEADARVTFNLARSLAWAGQTDQSIELFENAVSRADGSLLRAALTGLVRGLIELGRFDAAVTACQRLREASVRPATADFLEGQAQRRGGRPHQALACLARIDHLGDDDGNWLPPVALELERGGALLEAGQPGPAATVLLGCLPGRLDPALVDTLSRALTACGRSPAEIADNIIADDADRLALTLSTINAEYADSIGDKLAERFPSLPSLLAAAARFAPRLALPRALEWSHRVRQSGGAEHCPLIAVAADPAADPRRRLRAAGIAAGAFADLRALPLALEAVTLLDEDERGPALAELRTLALNERPATADDARPAPPPDPN